MSSSYKFDYLYDIFFMGARGVGGYTTPPPSCSPYPLARGCPHVRNIGFSSSKERLCWLVGGRSGNKRGGRGLHPVSLLLTRISNGQSKSTIAFLSRIPSMGKKSPLMTHLSHVCPSEVFRWQVSHILLFPRIAFRTIDSLP